MVHAGWVFVAGIHPSRTWTSIFWVRAMKCMCAQTRPRFILSSERVFRGMEFEPMLTPREKSPLLENVPRGGSNPRCCGQWAQTLPHKLFQPRHPCNTSHGSRCHALHYSRHFESAWEAVKQGLAKPVSHSDLSEATDFVSDWLNQTHFKGNQK